jgi:hypothetical protein
MATEGKFRIMKEPYLSTNKEKLNLVEIDEVYISDSPEGDIKKWHTRS